MYTQNISELPPPGTYLQNFNKVEFLNNKTTIMYGSGCYFGEGFILTTLFRDDLTQHDKSNPTHLNIQRKFEKILIAGSEAVIIEIYILNLDNTFWLSHSISW